MDFTREEIIEYEALETISTKLASIVDLLGEIHNVMQYDLHVVIGTQMANDYERARYEICKFDRRIDSLKEKNKVYKFRWDEMDEKEP
jgi:radical SAM superfamily enzyme